MWLHATTLWIRNSSSDSHKAAVTEKHGVTLYQAALLLVLKPTSKSCQLCPPSSAQAWVLWWTVLRSQLTGDKVCASAGVSEGISGGIKYHSWANQLVPLQPLSLRVTEEVCPLKAKLVKRQEIQGEWNTLPRVIYFYPGSVWCAFLLLTAQPLPLQESIQTALQQGPRGISPYRDCEKWGRHLSDNPRQTDSHPSAFSGLKPPMHLNYFSLKALKFCCHIG